LKLDLLLIPFLILVLLSVSCNTKIERDSYGKISSISVKYTDGYVGDQNCVSCHKKEVDLWKGSHHDLAMQIANESTVLGNFDDHKMTIDGVGYFFYKKKNKRILL